jgi:hypothetical protein
MWLPTVERNLLSVVTESSGTFPLLIVHPRSSSNDRPLVFMLHSSTAMLKLIGSYALAKLLGFGLVGAIAIYALLTLLT